ncbi:MAG: VOC family protein [Actinomycetota bacterium]|nr:VOC family protein [Actinomycetota bacterium]
MGRVIHFEIHAHDPERCAAFYRDAFGWEIQKWDGPVDYWLVTTGPDTEAGINGAVIRQMGSESAREQGTPNAFVNTIEVDSIDDAERAIPSAGGEQVVAQQELPGVGKLSYFKDTEGNIFGALEPARE